MSPDRPVEPDIAVQAALRVLLVPEHGPGFWDELDRLLGPDPSPTPGTRRDDVEPVAVANAAGAHAGPEVVELAREGSRSVLPPGIRQRSNAVAAVAAVAAAVLVVVAGAALVRQEGDDDTTDLAGSPATSAVSPRVDGAPPPDAPAAEPSALDGAAEGPSGAVLRWVRALGEGDADAAWAALGPASRAHLGGPAGLEDLMSALSEGYGAWSAATPDEVLVTPLASDGDAVVVIVTLVGDVEQEGSVQRRADAFAVRQGSGGRAHSLEPFDTAGPVEVVAPAPAAAGATARLDGDEVVVVVPLDAQPPVVRLDDGEPVVCGDAPGTELVELETAVGRRCAYTPEGGIPAGERVLTVAFTGADGESVSTESVRFRAA